MFLCEHLKDLLATPAAELVRVFRTGEGESLLAKRKAAEIAELCEGVHLLMGAERFDVSDDAPAVQDIDGCCKGRLPAVRNSVAELFEKGPF